MVLFWIFLALVNASSFYYGSMTSFEFLERGSRRAGYVCAVLAGIAICMMNVCVWKAIQTASESNASLPTPIGPPSPEVK